MKQGNFIRDTEASQYPAKPGPERIRWKVMGISSLEKPVPSLKIASLSSFNLRGCLADEIQPTVTKQILVKGPFTSLWDQSASKIRKPSVNAGFTLARRYVKGFSDEGSGRTCKSVKAPKKENDSGSHFATKYRKDALKKGSGLIHQGLRGFPPSESVKLGMVSPLPRFHGLFYKSFIVAKFSFLFPIS